MAKYFTINTIFILAILALLSVLVYFRLSKKEWQDSFGKHTYVVQNDTLPYRYYVPELGAGQKIPLVVYLHGGGECGNDNEKQLLGGVPYFMIDSIKAKYKCAVFAPQCAQKTGWVNSDVHTLSAKITDKPVKYLQMAFEVIDSLKHLSFIDSNRIYITGFSYGGYGTWDAISRKPAFFAAAAPLCGGGDTLMAQKIINVPVWAFHGGKDDIVSPTQTTAMVNAIKTAGGNAKITIYPDAEHYICDKAYTQPGFMQWMFSQTKK